RGIARIAEEAQRTQERLDDIGLKALPQFSPDARPQDIRDDWMETFVNHARMTTDQEMRTLWARILAGQATKPGSFSKRTLGLLSDLEKSEAELFTALCTFTVLGPGINVPVVFDFDHQIYTKRSINFQTLSHLDSIGLSQLHSVMGVEFKPTRGALRQFAY